MWRQGHSDAQMSVCVAFGAWWLWHDLCPFAACSNRTCFVMVSAALCLRTQVLLCRGAHAYGISRGCVGVPSLACWRFGPVIALPQCSFRCELCRHGCFGALHVCPLIAWLACVLSAWPLAHLLKTRSVSMELQPSQRNYLSHGSSLKCKVLELLLPEKCWRCGSWRISH